MMFGLSTIKLAIYGVIALGIAGAFGYVWWLRHEVTNLQGANAVLTADLTQAKAVNDANQAELVKIKDDAAQALAAVEKNHAAALAAATRTQTIKQDIARAPKADDATVAPVLGALLDRLRTAGTNAPDTNQGSPPGHSGAASPVRP